MLPLEVYLESTQTSMMELFCESSKKLKSVNYFLAKKLHHRGSTPS